MRIWITTLLLIFTATLGVAEEEPAPETDQKPSIEQIDATHFKIGKIRFNSKTREIEFQTTVNMDEGLLEFLLVHENGKIHESLLYTDISATNLNIALTLLHYKPTHGETLEKASRLQISLKWKEGDKERTATANELIQHSVKASAMPAGPWKYFGSAVSSGKYLPQITGDLIAIYTTQSAIITYPGESNDDDTVWFPYPKRVPAVGTPVTLIISPYPEDKP